MPLFTASRLFGAALFFAASTYCVVSYSSFAYYQFLAPGVVRWPAQFAAISHYLYWFWLLLVAGTFVEPLRQGRVRWPTFFYLFAATATGVWLLYNPLLATIDNTPKSLTVALVAMAFPIALALLDHLRLPVRTRAQPVDVRLFRWGFRTCLVIAAIYMSAAAYRWWFAPGLDLSGAGLVVSAFFALATLLLTFVLLTVLVAGGLAAGRHVGSGAGQYVVLLIVACAALAFVFYRVVFGAIAFGGPPAAAIASVWALMIVLVWSSLAAAWTRSRAVAPEPMSLWFAVMERLPPVVRLALLVALPIVVVAVSQTVERFDWDFLLQKMSVVAVWVIAAGTMWSGVAAGRGGARPFPWRMAAVLALVGLAGAVALPALLPPERRLELTLDRYATLDPSYRLIVTTAQRSRGEAAAFYRVLRAHSTIAHVDVAPVEVDFVKPLTAPAAPPPHIFLFVVDSLRRDFLSPYNPAVSFTPAIADFARDSIVFERPFSRYGATGLAVPSIWTGGMTLHKQYISPYAPMNTLGKLLDAGGYRRIMSVDPIAARLSGPSPRLVPLDAEVKITDYRLCRTLEELEQKLLAVPRDEPIFAYTLPQDIHVSNVFGASFPESKNAVGLFSPVANRVEEMDRCFGGFISFLEAHGFYDQSIVILTSDHGDSMGEEGRWGHAYTVFPEVMQIPLIIHLPDNLARSVVSNPSAVSFSSDISPTLYALLGYEPADLGPLYGAPLFVRRGAPRDRSRDRFLLASSYGAVYGLLTDDGRSLYIADAINGRDYRYDLSAGGAGVRMPLTDQMRASHRQLIREQVETIAAQYHFIPR